MNQTEKIWGIVPASGIGTRMVLGMTAEMSAGTMAAPPKQYLPLCGQRVLDHALLALCQSASVDGVIVGIRAGDKWWRAQPFAHEKLLGVSPGGEERAHTVLNALERLLEDNIAADHDWAMVHDGVRPCLRSVDVERLVVAARSAGSGAVLAVKLADTLKEGSGDGVIEKTLGGGGKVHWRALTPQLFRCGPLRLALRESLARGIVPTDESAAMEMTGLRPVAVEGHPANLKITVPADLELASLYLDGDMQ